MQPLVSILAYRTANYHVVSLSYRLRCVTNRKSQSLSGQNMKLNKKPSYRWQNPRNGFASTARFI